MSEPTNQQLLEVIERRFDDLQEQIINLSVAFVRADLIPPPDDAVAEKALQRAMKEASS